ncbi:MAG: MFS transporter [Alphaproteobacteria bacterium]|nr:MFS transporter [Alphaproteobacteria bacterium]
MTIATFSFSRKAVSRHRILGVACGAHAVHDGFTDTLYLLLPIFQTEFALSYAAIGVLRAFYTGAMAGLQVPASKLAEKVGAGTMLAGGTAIAGASYLCLGLANSVFLLAAALVLGGIGSSTQHPIASSLVANEYEGRHSRAALGTYNFAGDLGKMALPSITAALITIITWRHAASTIGLIGLAAAAAIAVLLRHRDTPEVATAAEAAGKAAAVATADPPRGGFPLLLSIGVIDSATRMGFLTFLPFLLRAKGAGMPEIGLALTLLFAGGAAGKLVCGFLGARLGVMTTVFLTEGGTALGIMALLPLPLVPAFALLPLLGIALNGTSSVLYGTVPELVPTERRDAAFGLFYTGTIGAGALSPAIYGLFSDAIGLTSGMLLVATMVLLTLPLAYRLRRFLAD